MRNVLTIVAVALVAMMFAALVAPRLVDWSAHRGEIEARLSAATGASVTLTGPIDASLLPTPYLSLGEGSVSAPGPDGARLSFASARLELALVKLASGRIRFSDISFEKPVLTLSRRADGTPRLPALRAERNGSTGFDRFIVRDGRLRIAAGAGMAPLEIGGVEVDASAPSLDGPVRLSGQFAGPDGAPVAFRLASETPGPDGTPLTAEVDPGPGWPALQFDGALAGDPAQGAAGLRLVGEAILTGTAPGEGEATPWRVSGHANVDLRQAGLTQAEFALGPDERAVRAQGAAMLAFGSPARLSLDLKAKQINLDALMRRKDEAGAAPARAIAFFARLASTALASGGSRAAIDLKLAAQPVILGAQTLSDAALALKATPGDPVHARFDLGLPGGGRLKGEGDLDSGSRPDFHGDLDFSAADFPLLRDWLSLGAPAAAARVIAFAAALPYRSVSVAGPVEVSASGVQGRSLRLALDRTKLTGLVALAAPSGGDAARLTLDLATDSLDVDLLPGLGGDAGAFKDLDLSLSLAAGSLHIARVGETEIDSGSLSLRATKTGPNMTLERLNVAGLDGAALDVQGSIGPDAVAASGRLRADRLRDFAALVSRLAPGALSTALVERAGDLSPAVLTFAAHGAGGGAAIDSLQASGTAGETQFTVALDPRPKDGGHALAVGLDLPNSGALLRQFGLRAAPGGGGRAHVAVNATGGLEQGFDIDATSSLAGADLSWRGRFLPDASSDQARLFGSARVRTPNLGPLAAALGVAPAGGGALGAAEAAFDATLRGDQWSLSRIAATVGGSKASGSLTFHPAAPADLGAEANAAIKLAEDALNGGPVQAAQQPVAQEIEGELAVDQMTLGNLLALALGPSQAPRPGTRWSEARFAAAPLRLPSAAVKLRVGALELADGLTARSFATALRFDKGRLDLDGLAMQVAGGAVSGQATLRRDGETATLTGTLAADSLAIDRASFTGRVGATIDFASTGRSPAALVDGLAGAGTVKFAGASLARIATQPRSTAWCARRRRRTPSSTRPTSPSRLARRSIGRAGDSRPERAGLA